MKKIPGGYYIKARCIQESAIAIAPPHVREIWDWLLKEANHADKNSHGTLIKRGQTMRTYEDIREGLKWMVGYRKEMYSVSQCEMALKWLTKENMITKAKTTRGLLITVCNYETYQDFKNYESQTESRNKATIKPQGSQTINNALNELKEVYTALEKNKMNIHNFIKDNKPKFIEPYVDLWNIFAKEKKMSLVEKITEHRISKFNTRVEESSFNISEILKKAIQSDFILSGKWFTFDWIIENEQNYVKVLEGHYDKGQQGATVRQLNPLPARIKQLGNS